MAKKREVIPSQLTSLSPSGIGEMALSSEHQVQSNRIVVLGSRTSGVFELAEEFDKLMEEQGITSPVVDATRNVTNIENAFYGRYPQKSHVPDSIPRGVVVLPEMRQYGPGGDMTIPSPVEFIKQLCDEYGVPMVAFSQSLTPEQLTQRVGELIAGSDW